MADTTHHEFGFVLLHSLFVVLLWAIFEAVTCCAYHMHGTQLANHWISKLQRKVFSSERIQRQGAWNFGNGHVGMSWGQAAPCAPWGLLSVACVRPFSLDPHSNWPLHSPARDHCPAPFLSACDLAQSRFFCAGTANRSVRALDTLHMSLSSSQIWWQGA